MIDDNKFQLPPQLTGERHCLTSAIVVDVDLSFIEQALERKHELRARAR